VNPFFNEIGEARKSDETGPRNDDRMGLLYLPKAVCIARNGDVIISDTNAIHRLTPEGKLILIAGSLEAGNRYVN
jgi:hypothetical protein